MTNLNTAENQGAFKQPNAEAVIKVEAKDLPIHCPMIDSSLWNSHPRVYIPVKENGGQSKCPYCGTVFKLLLY